MAVPPATPWLIAPRTPLSLDWNACTARADASARARESDVDADAFFPVLLSRSKLNSTLCRVGFARVESSASSFLASCLSGRASRTLRLCDLGTSETSGLLLDFGGAVSGLGGTTIGGGGCERLGAGAGAGGAGNAVAFGLPPLAMTPSMMC